MQAFERKQAKKLTELENKFQSQLKVMLEKIMVDLKDSMTKVMESMATQLESMQMTNLKQITQALQSPLATDNLSTDANISTQPQSCMVNIAQGRAHHNTFKHFSPPLVKPSHDDDSMQP